VTLKLFSIPKKRRRRRRKKKSHMMSVILIHKSVTLVTAQSSFEGEHFQHFINYMPLMTRRQKEKGGDWRARR